ncbi:MAG: type IV pilus secretin PilQ [Acidobacteria bacterium]|nr:type IV pilus secretin PilQ [Acidobacteriota bacterium]
MWAVPIAAVLAATLAASGPEAVNGPSVRSISGRLDGGLSTVLIESTEPVAYLTSQPDPLTVFVDLRNVRTDGLDARALATMQPPVSAVRVEPAIAPDGAPVARVRVALSEPARHRVRSSRNMIYVEVNRAATDAGVSQSQDLEKTAARDERPAATRLTGIKTSDNRQGTAVAIRGNGRLVASRVEDAADLPARVLLDFEGVATGNVPATTAVDTGDVHRVRVGTNSRDPLVTRVVIDLRKKAEYTVESTGDETRVVFARTEPGNDADAPAPPPVTVAPAPRTVEAALTSAAATTPVVQAPTAMIAAIANVAARPPDGPMAALALAQTPPAQQPAPGDPPASGEQRFTGHPVTFDFQGADLRAVLRTFAEISGLNIVIDPTIQGSVDVSLKEVPWDQALDIILKANKLGYAVDGSVVRIAPLAVLADEEASRRKLADAQALAGELRVMTRALSYAKAADLIPIITRSALSSRGDVQVDARTNTLIIRDLADRLTAAGDLITALDAPQPQVEIEARIVQTSRDFARALGVQWGVNGRMDPALGNGTNLAFPNTVDVSGRVGGQQGPGAAATGVNLPAPSATSALGLALGSINGALNLDVALSALERTGKGRLLSTPRVSTQNNIEAEMYQGVQIPVQTQANNTVSVSFKDAALSLRVTPQITASGTVIMRITLENAAPDYSRSVGGIPPIDTQRATTTVLVTDGETTVIGGIYTSREQVTEGRTPFLNRIPLLGWLFKRDEMSDESRELLIFITPRITKG